MHVSENEGGGVSMDLVILDKIDRPHKGEQNKEDGFRPSTAERRVDSEV